jgi:hypothetical protein
MVGQAMREAAARTGPTSPAQLSSFPAEAPGGLAGPKREGRGSGGVDQHSGGVLRHDAKGIKASPSRCQVQCVPGYATVPMRMHKQHLNREWYAAGCIWQPVRHVSVYQKHCCWCEGLGPQPHNPTAVRTVSVQ